VTIVGMNAGQLGWHPSLAAGPDGWLTIGDGEEVVTVTVTGGVAADRSDELWSATEGALETADSRLVITDMTMATGFDVGTMQALAQLAVSARRRRLDFCSVLRPHSSLEQYARSLDLGTVLPIFHSAREAVAASRVGSLWPALRAS
jgi:hypothetical protein